MINAAARALAQFSSERFTPVVLNQTEHSLTMVVGLEAGQAIPVHHPGTDLTMVIIEGQATLVSGDEELKQAGPGAVMTANGSAARGIRADERTIVLVVASPPPTQADHSEVMAHLQNGTWR